MIVAASPSTTDTFFNQYEEKNGMHQFKKEAEFDE